MNDTYKLNNFNEFQFSMNVHMDLDLIIELIVLIIVYEIVKTIKK